VHEDLKFGFKGWVNEGSCIWTLREEDVATSCFMTNYLDDIIQIDEWVMEFVKDITPLTIATSCCDKLVG
jgi:hypothetical protein